MLLIFAALGLRINLTPSHPRGIYRMVDAEPAVGHYALFCAPVRLAELPEIDSNAPAICTLDQSGFRLMKRIVAIDEEARTARVIGDHPSSIDSRHFGDVAFADIEAVLVPFWLPGVE